MSRAARYYPPTGEGGRRTVIGDVIVVLLIVLFAWVGLKVHDSIAGLADMTRSVSATGTSISETGAAAGGEIRTGFGAAADAVGRAPLIGGDLSRQLRGAGDRSAGAIERQARANGAQLREAGEQGTEDILQLARLIGWLSFLVPTILLLSQALPTRLRRLRTLRA